MKRKKEINSAESCQLDGDLHENVYGCSSCGLRTKLLCSIFLVVFSHCFYK